MAKQDKRKRQSTDQSEETAGSKRPKIADSPLKKPTIKPNTLPNGNPIISKAQKPSTEKNDDTQETRKRLRNEKGALKIHKTLSKPHSARPAEERKASTQTRQDAQVSAHVKREKNRRAPHQRAEVVKANSQGDAVVEKQTAVQASGQTWFLASPTAGRYIDHDSIFVSDEAGEECVIVANSCEIQLLSLSTSLPVRSQTLPDRKSVACFSLSPSSDDIIDIAFDDGTKMQWLWRLNQLSETPGASRENVVALTKTLVPDGTAEAVYIVSKQQVFSIMLGGRSLFSTEQPLTSIQVLGLASCIVATGPHAVVLGYKTRPQQAEFRWVEMPSTAPLTCADARLTDSSEPGQSHKRPNLALVVGNAAGQLHLYTDLLGSKEVTSQHSLPTPKILHWHREAVSAVKFSRDGLYIISGGRETVLVIWQLETGIKQFLPHLASEIERIVVSSNGSRYALQLGNNSIMVLSTSELKPVANFAGLQMSLPKRWHNEQSGARLPRPTISRGRGDQLLLSVPSTQPKLADDILARPFLQTFDMRNSRHISRQALARNNVTDFGDGPEGNRISPPDVYAVALSADGCWLATLDEWIPPATDLEHAVPRVKNLTKAEIDVLEEEQDRRREVFLKFWFWDSVQEMWTLDTRVDSPHKRTNGGVALVGAGRTFALSASPASNTFATIGEDNCVRIWRRTVRTQNGKPIRDRNDSELMKWSCKKTITLALGPADLDHGMDSIVEESEEEYEIHDNTTSAMDGCINFSQDGSLLACSLNLDASTAVRPIVHLISTRSGEAELARADFAVPEQDVEHVSFHDRYLITVSTKAFRVWNLVEDRHHYTVGLITSASDEDDGTDNPPLFAVNVADGAMIFITEGPQASESLARIYSPKKPECISEHIFRKSRPVGVMAARVGFTILFDDGTIRTLGASAGNARMLDRLPSPVEEDATPDAVALISTKPDEVVVENISDSAKGEPLAFPFGETEDDRQVVRPEQLAAIFDVGPSFAMPPMKTIFDAVVGLFGRKPKPKIVAVEV